MIETQEGGQDKQESPEKHISFKIFCSTDGTTLTESSPGK